MKRLKKVMTLAVWVLIFVCCVLSFYILDRIEALYSTVSLRYATPLSSIQVDKARDYASSNANVQDILLAFWTEQNVDIQTEYKTVAATNIAYFGEGNRAYSASFISGWYPSESDLYGCVVSDTVAWNLWGSVDALGQRLSYNEQEFLVRGVFKDSKSIVLNCAEGGFTAAELYRTDGSDVRQYVNSFAISSGLGAPFQIANGGDIVGLARMISFTPVVLALILFLLELKRISRYFKKSTLQITWLILALITTICLPSLLIKIPEWMLPSMWSDFSFWGSLWEIIKSKVADWFSLVPTIKEVSTKFLLLSQVIVSFIIGIAVYTKH